METLISIRECPGKQQIIPFMMITAILAVIMNPDTLMIEMGVIDRVDPVGVMTATAEDVEEDMEVEGKI